MQSTDRDRCRSAIAALCLALILIPGTAFALEAEYRILPNGTAYEGAVEIRDADRYMFTETGLLGERTPIQVTGVTLSGECPPPSCNFTFADRFTITFPKGNYTVRFYGPIKENHFLASFTEPYSVTVYLPQEFDVRNRFIGSISQGAEVRQEEGGSVVVTWNATKNAELRFYTKERVTMLTWFGQFWIIVAIVLLIPFVFTKRRRE